MTERCKKTVYRSGGGYSHVSSRANQCKRAATKDGYCAQHHPDAVKKRQEESDKKFQEQMDQREAVVAYRNARDAAYDEILSWVDSNDDYGYSFADEVGELIRRAERLNPKNQKETDSGD